MNQLEYLIVKLKSKYDFKFNLVTSKVYYKQKHENQFKEVNDFRLNSLFVEFKKEFKGISQGDFHSLLKSDVCTPYDPFKEYFSNLPEWDTKTDYIEQLSNTITTDDKSFWNTYFKKWLVGVVSCLLTNNDNHMVLIFVGDQGIGKTTWLNNLLPKELNDYLYMGTINNNKDSQINLSECMFINIDEFETIGNKGLKQLKSIITQKHIRIRRPYGKIYESLPRRASFMASVNDYKFLVDSTGNRRFLVVETNEIDINHKVDINKVYSQCLFLLKNDFRHYLNTEEIIKVSEKNEKYRIYTFEEQLLLKNFKVPKKGKGKVLCTSDVLDIISQRHKIYPNNTHLINLGRAFSKNGFKKGRTKNKRWGWWVSEKKPYRKNDI